MLAEKADITYRRISQAEADEICARHEKLWRCIPGGARAVFAYTDISGLDFRGRHLADADFTGAVAHHTNFTGAKLDNANLFCIDLQNAKLAESSMRRADLRGACL